MESNVLSLHQLGSSSGQVTAGRSVDRGAIRALAFHEDGSLSISRLPAPEARASSACRLRALSLLSGYFAPHEAPVGPPYVPYAFPHVP